jgi:hypothetical protein
MYQSIALSNKAIGVFEKELSKWLTAVTLLLKEKEIFVSTNFHAEVETVINRFDNTELSELFLKTLSPILNKLKKANLTDLDLAENSKDKILISNDKKLKLQLKFNYPNSDISICAFQNYINPTKEDRVANPRSIIDLVPNEMINPELVLFPYLKISKKIEIKDPYPPIYRTKNGNVRSLPIWNDMISSCPNAKIILVTHSSTFRQKRLGGANYDFSENDIDNALGRKGMANVEIRFSNTYFHGRPIKTDHFHIQIENGLRMFKKQKDGTYTNYSGAGASIIITNIEK